MTFILVSLLSILLLTASYLRSMPTSENSDERNEVTDGKTDLKTDCIEVFVAPKAKMRNVVPAAN